MVCSLLLLLMLSRDASFVEFTTHVEGFIQDNLGPGEYGELLTRILELADDNNDERASQEKTCTTIIIFNKLIRFIYINIYDLSNTCYCPVF